MADLLAVVRWVALNEQDPELGLRVMTFPTGIKRLVMVGYTTLTDAQSDGLAQMGFYRLHNGLLVCDQLKFDLDALRRAFPQTKAVTIPMGQVVGALPVPGGDPTRPDNSTATRAQVMTVQPLGQNFRGDAVYQGADGRFIRRQGQSPINETSGRSAALFLRGEDESDLALCAEGFVRQIAQGRNMRFPDLRRAAAIVSDTPEDQVLYTPHMRRYQEAVEAALVRHVRKHGSRNTQAGFDLALRLEEGQPNFQARTSDAVSWQQYSTTLSISTAVQRILGPIEGKSILEPTIGNGSLVSLLYEVTVVGVDMDVRRLAQTKLMLPDASLVEGDATRIDFRALNDGKAYDAIICNPPFGGLKSAQMMQGLKVSRIDHQILMRSLEARADDGVGVFIIGADSNLDRKAGHVVGGSRYLFNWLSDHYDTDVVEVDGSLYAKQGASFPIRIVVVWGKGASANPIPDELEVIKDHSTLLEWSTLMAAKGRSLARTQQEVQQDLADEHDQDQAQAVIDAPITEFALAVETAEEPLLAVNETLDGDQPQANQVHETPAEENSYQSPYAPASNVGEPTSMIPRNLASATRGALELIAQQYGDIDAFVAERLDWTNEELEAYLSPEQVDAVALGISAQLAGRSLLEGDQTGLGKGRVMAAMARYSALQGVRTVFLTETPTLFTDFYRDLRDIDSESLFRPLIVNSGVSIWDPITGDKLVSATPTATLQRMVQGDHVDDDYNLVLGTYSQFNRTRDSSAKARWIITAAQGSSLLLDEAHNAAGDSNTGENIRLAADVAHCVTYSSATSIKQSKNVLLYSRLFPRSVDLQQLPETLTTGGEVLQEVLSGMLAADGVFIRREHDLSALEFRTVADSKRLVRNVDYSDRLASILELMNYLAGDINKLINERNRDIRELLEKLPDEERKGNRMGAVSLNFGSRLFAIYRQFQLAIKTDLAIEEAVTALQEGKKPVFVLENTMESLLRDLVDRDRPTLDEGPDGDSVVSVFAQEVRLNGAMTFRDVLHRMLGRLSYFNETGRYGDVQQVPVSSDEALETMQRIRKLIDDFPDLPISPLDEIRDRITAAGYRCDELSGRKMRIESRDEALYAVPVVERPKAHVVKDFNTGTSDALLLTGAGSTGISLHASEKFPDRRQRVLIELQTAADVNRRVQFAGRVNRLGQVNSPIVLTLTSGLIGEARPIAMQNAKLRRLSANTTANQDNAALDKNVPDFINVIGNEVAKRYLDAYPTIAVRLDIDMDREEETKDDTYYINKLTSRLVMLSNAEQEQIYEVLTKEYRGIVDELNAKGTNPLRSTDFDVKARLIKREVFEQGHPESHSQFDLPVYINLIEHDEVLEPIRRGEIEQRMRDGESMIQDAKINTQHLAPGQFFLKLKAALINGRNGLLQQVKPERFKDTTEALASKESNAVQRMLSRLKFLDTALDGLDVGCVVRFTGNDGEPERGIVTCVHLPQKASDVHLPGAYELHIAVPGRKGVVARTLHSLETDTQFVLFSKAQLLDMLRECDAAPEGLVQRRRLLLDGNLFQAAQLAASRRLGSSVVYTDQDGRRHRGVLLARGVSMKQLAELPVRVESASLAAQLLDAHPEIKLISTGDRDSPLEDQDAVCMLRGREAHFAVPGTRTRGGSYFENKDLIALTGEFNGNRKQMVATFPADNLEAALRVLYRDGVSFYAPSRTRTAYNAIKADIYSNQSQDAERLEPALSP